MRISDWSSDVCSSDLRINPRNVDAIIFRGTLIRDQYGLRAALPWFRKALAIDRNNVPALGEYAATLGEIGRTRQMLALTRKMIALDPGNPRAFFRSEEHTSELQSLMRISYAVFCLKKKNKRQPKRNRTY